jgi:hypothetical protein
MKGSKITYPKRGYLQFDGGMDSKFQKALLPDNESPDCANVVFSEGAVETREGYSKANSSSVGSAVCDGLYTRHDTSGNQTMLAWFGGTLYGFNINTFVSVTSAKSVYTAGQRVAGAEYEGHMFFGNGGTTPYKYDGTDFTRHGVPAATGVVSVASDTSSQGDLNGAYSWKVTYVNSQAVEGDVGTAISGSLASGIALLTDIPTAPQSHGVDARRIYRTVTSGATFLRVGEISDNTTTTYNDTTSDAGLGTEAPTDAGEPPNYDAIVYHQNRLWCNDPANPNFVWYSDLAEPYTFASTNFIRVGDNSTDVVRGFSVYSDGVVVHCDTTHWLIYLPDATPANWSTVRIKTPFGCKSPYAPVMYNNKILFPAMQADKVVGFAAIEGVGTAPDTTFLTVASTGSDLKSNRIEPEMFTINETYVKNISGMVYKNKAYVSVTNGSGNTTNNRIWVYDFGISRTNRDQEAVWSMFTGINAAQFCVLEGELYFGSSTANGMVYRLYDGTYTDDGAAINSYWYTKEYGGHEDHWSNHKDFRTAHVLVQKAGSYYMNLTRILDSDDGGGTTHQIDLTPSGSLWGTMDWGDDWGGAKTDEEVEVFLGVAAGKRIQFKFDNQNTAGQKFKVNYMRYNYNLKGRR